MPQQAEFGPSTSRQRLFAIKHTHAHTPVPARTTSHLIAQCSGSLDLNSRGHDGCCRGADSWGPFGEGQGLQGVQGSLWQSFCHKRSAGCPSLCTGKVHKAFACQHMQPVHLTTWSLLPRLQGKK